MNLDLTDDGKWIDAPPEYIPLGPYSGLQFPIRKGLLPHPWLIIDECRMCDGCYRIKVHFDGDLSEQILQPECWRLWPNRKKLAQWYNEPFRRMTRLAEARATSYSSRSYAVFENHWLAEEALELQAAILADPQSEQATGSGMLDWSPSGQVWLRGKRWVRIEQQDVEGTA